MLVLLSQFSTHYLTITSHYQQHHLHLASFLPSIYPSICLQQLLTQTLDNQTQKLKDSDTDRYTDKQTVRDRQTDYVTDWLTDWLDGWQIKQISFTLMYELFYPCTPWTNKHKQSVTLKCYANFAVLKGNNNTFNSSWCSFIILYTFV